MALQENKTAWRDLWLVPIVFVGIIVFTILQMLICANMGVKLNENTMTPMSALGQMNAYIVVLLVYYYFHYAHMPYKLKAGYDYVKKHWLFLFIMLLLAMGLESLYNQLMAMLPQGIGFEETQNEQELNGLFTNLSFLPFSFLFVVVLAPVVEELFFRRILIGELGKKFNFKVMGVLSAIGFAGMHVMGASSPLEFGSYFIIAIVLVYVYFKSGKNTAATIAIHMSNNLVSYIITVFFT